MSSTWQDLRVLVVGCGSIGKRHSRVLREIGVKTLFACDPVPAQIAAAAEHAKYDATAEAYEAGLALKPDAVFLCTPPALHIPQALEAMSHGCHVFCEKPLSTDLNGTDELAHAIARTSRTFMVGLCFRYHQGLLKAKRLLNEGTIGRLVSVRAFMGEHLPAIRPDYRDLYLAKYNGAFELMHDIDLAIWYTNQDIKMVRGINGRFSDIGIEAPDLVEILMEFEDRCVANVHLDFFALPRRRQIELLGTKGTVTVEFASWDQCTISVYDVDTGSWLNETVATDRDDMFRDEDREFLQAAAEYRPVACTLAEGIQSLEVVLKAQEQSG